MSETEEEGAERRRAELLAEINARQWPRARLVEIYGEVWDSSEFFALFEVEQYLAPVVLARRRADNVEGTAFFQHSPRFYWGFEPHG